MSNITQWFVAAIAAVAGSALLACPYCTVESSTLSEEMEASDAVVLAKLIKPAAPLTDGPNELGEFGVIDPDTGRAKFRIERVLVGQDVLAGVEEIDVVFFGEPDMEQTYFIRGVGLDGLDWNIPIPMSPTAIDYVERLQSLPTEGPERMKFFLKYVQHEDPLLAQDAYDEFARAPYADVVAIADQIDREQLWEWLGDRTVSPSRRSLFFVMLGVTGTPEDEQRLLKMMLADGRVLRAAAEASASASLGLGGAVTMPIVPEMVAMEQRKKQLGFNAMVGCYLKLTGARGLDVLDERFLLDPDEDPTKVYGVLLALRFLAEETDDVSQERLMQSMRLVLEKPDFAEQAIRDLARWQDWSVLDRLVAMFKEAPPNTYVKDPIVAYLDQAAQQEGDVGERASAALEEIERLEPETVKRARSLMSFGFLGWARSGSRAADEAPPLNPPDETPAPDSYENSTPENDAPGIDDLDIDDPSFGPDGDSLYLEDTNATMDEPLDSNALNNAESAPATQPPTTDEAVAADTDDSAAVNSSAADPETGANVEVAQTTEGDKPANNATVDPPTEYNRAVVLGVPLVAAVVLAGLMWLVLRGGA